VGGNGGNDGDRQHMKNQKKAFALKTFCRQVFHFTGFMRAR